MRVYLDHNATSPLRPEARERWLEVSRDVGANPSSVHAAGRAARDVIDRARDEVARVLGVGDDELVFTSCGTESNNLALRGGLEALGAGAGLVTSRAEHSSVLGTARALEQAGRRVTWLDVDAQGVPSLDGLAGAEAAASPALLVSLMAANNEVGSLTQLARVRDHLAAGRRCVVHTDAVQALGKIPVRLRAWGVQLASFSAHKVGGPQGVGVLWRERGTPLLPTLTGGGQETGLRAGTENVAGIAAAARAIALAVEEQALVEERVRALCLLFWQELRAGRPEARLFGPPLDAPRLGNTLCIGLPGVDGKVAVTRLDLEGVEVSAGSACASGSIEPSHVLLAMGTTEDEARAAIRVSLGRHTTEDEVRHAADVLRKLPRPSRAT